ncbi:MAG: dTDP-4-dehydrorhamnose 3,5-epimerase, partial [Actinomycetota bacterium]|nr:dTDP-4-dehydrorhamnose 3,5-epimerase [Actinomycetota bacterium]
AYLCSESYAPAREHAVNASDTQLAINWGTADVTISDRDGAAPSLNDAPPRYCCLLDPKG